ncbi:helix-turn-helix transcriptional regulator [Candidatus Desantisbacteria bacterium]|nr:helix-turn-helix transcriptional regulator [Candidatus Desantisbacteria bacterium]
MEEQNTIKKTNYTCETQQNLMKVVEYLALDIWKPQTIDEICKALDLSKNKVNWTLHNLEEKEWTEQVVGGWRISPKIIKIADSVRRGFLDVFPKYLNKE